jgi:hypothetical protein
MKQTRSSKHKTNARIRSGQNPEVNVEAVSMLRSVKDKEAFYFYEAVGKPTGEVARNLSDFLDKVKSVKTESLAFHLQRSDFQNWVQKILGDAKLAEKLEDIPVSKGDEIRTSICNAVENRIKELSASSATIHVGNNSVLLPARA